ncbi:MAG: phosphatidylglycerophosphatase A [Rickettsiales bacterium]|jgi:phosphatidylglycerophosphatase A|nr:phosphatidylglycerophosphatase A [Rickettsiales bacterium]
MLGSRAAESIATFFGLGRSKLCPGTLGSLAAFPLWFLVLSLIKYFDLRRPLLILFALIAGLFFLAFEAITIYTRENKTTDDPSEVVIDEVLGQLLSFLLSLFIISHTGKYTPDFFQEKYGYILIIFSFVTPFILFRIYDIGKPWIIGKIDREMKGALGIILDDIGAGLLAGLTNIVLFKILLFLFL